MDFVGSVKVLYKQVHAGLHDATTEIDSFHAVRVSQTVANHAAMTKNLGKEFSGPVCLSRF